jgi:hypothetical protein
MLRRDCPATFPSNVFMIFTIVTRLKNVSITEAAKKYANNNTGKVRFDNEAILIVGKK